MTAIQEMQKIELNMIVEVDRICRKYNIKYTLLAGSLLGAIRHGGFIPWDDDVDMGMTLENYNKFLEVASKELPKHMIIENPNTNKDCPHYFTKIIDINTTFIDGMILKLNTAKGLGIDIFPIYGMPNKNSYKIFLLRNWTNFLVQNYCYGIDDKKSKYYYLKTILRFFTKKIKMQTIQKKFLNKVEKLDLKSREVTFADSWLDNVVMRYDIFNDYQDINFDGCILMSIVDYDTYLTKLYGDYMTPPPEDQRIIHKCAYWNANKPYKEYLQELQK